MSEPSNINQTVRESGYVVTSGTGSATIHIYNYGYREEVRDTPVKLDETATDEKLRSPYRGLFHFDPEDAEFFFGREVFVTELVQATQNRNFIPVLGASGSGKSSVVFAGLVPQLKQSGHWKFTHFRPGAYRKKEGHSIVDPFYALATALVPVYEPNLNTTAQLAQASELAEYLRNETVLLSDVVTKFQHNYPQHRLLVIADQFEELYTSCQDDKLRRDFLDKLLDSIHSPISQAKSPLVLVAAMRVDFWGDALSYPRFGDMLRNADIKIRAMNREELSQVIEKPAQKLGVMFEAGLVERILNDVEDEPGNLPLLEFALTSLWYERQGNQLTHCAYKAIGEVKGALTSYAEQKYGQLNPNQQKQVQRIFIQLVRPGEGTEDTRRLATKSELGDARWSLVQQLADERLVVTSRNAADQETVEVVHEALIGNWSQLRQWMVKDRLFRAWQERLRAAMRQWEEKQRDEGALLRGALLTEAQEKLEERREELSPSEQDFIQQSIQLRDRLYQQEEERRQRELETAQKIAQESEGRRKAEEVARREAEQRAEQETKARKAAQTTTRVTVGAGVLVLGFAFFSGFQWRNSEINQILALKESSNNLFDSNQKLDALISSLRAGKKLNQLLLRIFPPPTKLKDEVKGTLQKVVYQVKERNRLYGDQSNNGISVSFIPDNPQQLVTAGKDGTIKLWNFQGRKLFSWQNKLKISHISTNPINPKDQILATIEESNIRLWNLKGRQLDTWKDNQSWIGSISFSPNGQQLANAGEKGASLWNLKGQRLAYLETADQGWVWSVSFSPKEPLLATVGRYGTRLWNLQNRQVVAKLDDGREYLRGVSFSPDGQKLATAGDDRKVCLWDVQNPQFPRLITCWVGNSRTLSFVSFSPDGQLLATGGDSDTTRLWNLEGQQVAELKGNKNWVTSISFSSDGKRLATARNNNTVDLWDLQGQQVATMVDRQDPIKDISFSPDGKQLVTGGEKGTVRLRDLQGKELRKFSAHQGSIESISFSPNGQQLTTVGDDSTIRSWNLQGQKLLEEKFSVDVKNDFKCYKFAPKCFWFSPDKRLLAGITDQGSVHVRNLQGEELISSPIDRNPNNHFKTLEFSPDSRLLAGVQLNGSVYMWDLQDRSPKTKTNFFAHLGTTTSVIFYSNNQKLATAENEGNVRLWDLQGNQLFSFIAHQSPVRVQSLSLSSNGQLLATVGDDGTVRLWNFQGEQLAEFPANARRVIFSPDNQKLATIAYDGTVKVWQIETFEELMQRGCNWVRDYLENNQTGDKDLCNSIWQE